MTGSVASPERNGEVRGNELARLLVPNAALSLAVFTLVYCLAVFDGWHQLFRDSDTGWHIRTGETILTTGHLPASDPYSFTRAGSAWLDWEWAADVLIGLAHRTGDTGGVAILFAVAVSACTWMWVRLTLAAGGDLLLMFLSASPVLSTANLHWLARPHVFGWLFLMATLWMLETRSRWGWFALLGMAWANIHGSFVVGPVLCGLYFFGRQAGDWMWDRQLKPDWSPALAGAALAAGSLVNPAGWKLHEHVLQYLGNSELLSRIGEFQTFNFHAPGSWQILACLLAAGLGTALAPAARRPEHFLVGTLLIVFAIRSARGLPIVALAVIPLANASITCALRSARGLAPRLKGEVERFLNYSNALLQIDRSVSGAALVPVFLGMAVLTAGRVRSGFPADQFPVAASEAVAALPQDARILAPDKFGGYLIYRFHGSRKVFFDGRSDFYGAAFMKDYIRLIEGRPGWREQVRQFGFTHALLPNNYTLLDGLQQSGWRPSYTDATATLLAAPGR